MKKHILFVDDEPKILEALRRMLRSMRQEWEMTFVETGPAALEMLNLKTFDVIVSDMRMPGIDGSQLLLQVKQLYPEIVRIVLSGYSDQKAIVKSIQTAHQYLSKPCDSELLISTVKRCCALRDLLGQESLKRVVSGIGSLPSLPSLYAELMEEIQSQDGSVYRVGKIIEKDPSMSAKILQVVNSSFFGLPRQISHPSHAVALLGFDIVRALVLAIGLFSKFDPSKASMLIIDKIYVHSMKVSATASKIAKNENMDKEMVDNSFMAGLLHDLGKLVLASEFPESYRKVFELSRHERIAFYKAETEILGATHAEIGAYLLGLWGLPDTIVEGLAFHHNPGNSPSIAFNPLAAVYVANILEHRTDATVGKENHSEDFDTEYLNRIGLNDMIPVQIDISQQMEGDME